MHTLNAKSLLRAITALRRLQPHAGFIHLHASAGRLHVSGHLRRGAASLSAPCAWLDASYGAMCVDTLSRVLRGVDGDVTITRKAESASLRTSIGEARVQIQSQDAPELPTPSEPAEVQTSLLLEAVRRVGHATSADPCRPALDRVQFAEGRAFATDGHRLSVAPDDSGMPEGASLPSCVIPLLIFCDPKRPILYAEGKHHLSMWQEGIWHASASHEAYGKPTNWKGAVSESTPTTTVAVCPDALCSALRAADRMGKPERRGGPRPGVLLGVASNSLAVSTGAGQTPYRAEVSGVGGDAPAEVLVHPKYLADAAKAATPSDGMITLQVFMDCQTPQIRIAGHEGELHVVALIRTHQSPVRRHLRAQSEGP